MKKQPSRGGLTRRDMLKLGLVAGGSAMLPLEKVRAKRRRRGRDNGTSGSSASAASFPVTPWQQPLFVPKIAQAQDRGTLDPAPGMYPRNGGTGGGPARPREPRTPDNFNDVAHGIAPEFDGRVPGFPCPDWNIVNPGETHEKEYKLITEETTQEIILGVPTPVFVYRDFFNPMDPGMTPGPTFVARFRRPVVVRNENHLTRDRGPVNTTAHDHETSIHQHGGHLPANADGYPDFYVLAGETRDYYYPNIAPRETQPDGRARVCDGDFDETWIPSTLWYHDHGMDVTGFNVSRGLAGFYLVFDDRELELILNGTLPVPGRDALESLGVDPMIINNLLGGPPGTNDAGFDFGLALQDQRFEMVNGEPRLAYDFLDHNGHLGDVFTVNGRAQPYFNVQRRKYHFRILNASNARVYRLRLSSGQPFIVFGADSWLFPEAGAVDDFELASGQRHDVIIDFSGYFSGTEVFLENIMIQDDGSKGDEVDPENPTRLLKFIVQGALVTPDVTIEAGTTIRGFAPAGQWAPIPEGEIVGTREFKFDRSHGAWTVNGDFFNPRRADAVPELGTAERWILENSSGGWWHPIHMHLEGFQIRKLNGEDPPFERSFNSDLVNLHGGEEAKVFIKFRTFTGPFVFHCHNIEHEDMRMMGVHDPQPRVAGVVESPLDGVSQIDPEVSGVVPDCIDLEAGGFIFFDVEGDVDRLEGRGVGFPECEFEGND